MKTAASPKTLFNIVRDIPVNLAGRAADVFDGLLGLSFLRHGFLAHLRSMKATMSQKPSVPQDA